MRLANWMGAGLVALGIAGCGAAPPQPEADSRREAIVETSDRAQRAVSRGELRRGAALYREALRRAEAIEDFRAIELATLNLAATLQALGEIEAAHRALDRILAAPARFEQWAVAEAAAREAMIALDTGALDSAGKWLARAEAECRPPSCRMGTALLTLNGRLQLERGAAAAARELAARALAASRSEGGREEEANALRLEGRAAARLGELVPALAALSQALELDKQLALPQKIALDLLALAEVELGRGERSAARSYALRARNVSAAAGSKVHLEAALRLLERAQ